MKSTALRTMLVLAGMLVAVAPAWCQQYRTRPVDEREGEFRLRLGAFRPAGESEYWDDKKLDFTGDAGDLEGPSVGLDYFLGLNNNLSLVFSGSYFQGETTQSYRDFLDNFGDKIRHDANLDIGSATLGLVVHFAGPDASVRPYVGVGGGAYFWRLEENGDFVDFNRNNEIFNARLKSDGTAFGGYGMVGLGVPVSRNLSVFGEARFTKVDADLQGDFDGFGKIDLSGLEAAVGLSWSL